MAIKDCCFLKDIALSEPAFCFTCANRKELKRKKVEINKTRWNLDKLIMK
jgi:hypothetical protein